MMLDVVQSVPQTELLVQSATSCKVLLAKHSVSIVNWVEVAGVVVIHTTGMVTRMSA